MGEGSNLAQNTLENNMRFSYESNATKWIVVIASVFLTVLLAITYVSPSISEWTASLWVIDYPGEFIKRGLIGALLNTAFAEGTISLASINLFANAVLFLLSALLALYFSLAFIRKPVLILVSLLAGFSLQQYIYDVGRFDQINLLITVILLLLLNYKMNALNFMASVVLSACMLLIHEASVLINVPLIFASLLIKQPKQPYWAGTYLVLLVAAFLCVVYWGALDHLDYPDWMGLITSKKLGFGIDHNAISVVGNSTSYNLSLAFDRLSSPHTYGRFLRVMLVLIPFFILFRQCRSMLSLSLGGRSNLIFLPVLACFPLFFLGIDFYRWIAAILMGCLLLVGFCMMQKDVEFIPNRIGNKTLFAAVVFSVYSGPLGISVALPESFYFRYIELCLNTINRRLF